MRTNTREDIISQEGGEVEDGVLCLDYRGDWWEAIGPGDSRNCDYKCECHGCWDEASCPSIHNISREQMMREEDRYTVLVFMECL